MRVLIAVTVGLAALTFGALPAGAQPQVPRADSQAVGGDLGFYVGQEEFHVGANLAGYGEYYYTPRMSVRGSLGWSHPGLDPAAGDTLRQVRLLVNVLYNWESGIWHPFVTAGFGAFFLQPQNQGQAIGESQTKPAMTFGGGVEYFSRRRTTIKAEALFHAVGHDHGRPDPSGLTLTAGVKRYF